MWGGPSAFDLYLKEGKRKGRKVDIHIKTPRQKHTLYKQRDEKSLD